MHIWFRVNSKVTRIRLIDVWYMYNIYVLVLLFIWNMHSSRSLVIHTMLWYILTINLNQEDLKLSQKKLSKSLNKKHSERGLNRKRGSNRKYLNHFSLFKIQLQTNYKLFINSYSIFWGSNQRNVFM